MIVDGHCDTIKEVYKRGLKLTDTRLKFNLSDAILPMLQMMAIYIYPEEASNGYGVAMQVINKFEEESRQLENKIIPIKFCKDIAKIKEDCIGMMLTTENGSVIQGKLENVDKLYERGVRMMSIVWNVSNELASGAMEKADKGLTKLGKEFVVYLNRKNILIDVSHSSLKTFWDTAQITQKPIVASHSCVYELCNHPRNLRDNQIKEIAKLNGIIGVAFCHAFLVKRF